MSAALVVWEGEQVANALDLRRKVLVKIRHPEEPIPPPRGDAVQVMDRAQSLFSRYQAQVRLIPSSMLTSGAQPRTL